MRPVGIIGGGQLARMLALAAHPLGLRCRVFDPSSSPAAAAVAEHVLGDFEDGAALLRFADAAEVITFEMEHLPEQAIAALLEGFAHQRREHAALGALRVARDRLLEKTFINGLGIDTSDFAAIDDGDDLDAAIARLGLPLFLKTRTQGYDGRGQRFAATAAAAHEALRDLGGRNLIGEARVPFDREMSIIAVRSQNGEIVTYPLVENYHRDGILRWSLAPAPGLDAILCARAETIVRRIVSALDYVGVITVELFQIGDHLLVNEMAPRVHNSGHWTIEGADTSQFENHLRAILGLPLGATTTHGSWILFNLLGAPPDLRRALALPGAHLHLYDKASRPGRKIGHVTFRANDPQRERARLQELLGLS